MKNILIFFLLLPIMGSSQQWCFVDVVELDSQEEIDSFPAKYPDCTHVHSIRIDDREGKVYNLDSLRQVIRVRELFIGYLPDLASMAGLDNLQKVDRSLVFNQSAELPGFSSLDTINRLDHTMNANAILDLSIYQNVKHIRESIGIVGNGLFTGFPAFTCDLELDTFSIHVRDNSIANTMENIIPKNTNHIKGFTILRSPNIQIRDEDFLNIQNIYNFRIHSTIREIDSLNHIRFYFVSFVYNELDNTVFDVDSVQKMCFHIDTLESLGLNNTNCVSLSDVFPNLKYISNNFGFGNNKDLTDISLLTDFDLPLDREQYVYPDLYTYSLISVNNPNLDMCNIDYICRLIARGGDSMVIQNNGPNCYLEKIREDCVSDVSDEFSKAEIKVSILPNPSTHYINISSNEAWRRAVIYDSSGRLVYARQSDGREIEVGGYADGMYIVKVELVDGRVVYTRFVKGD